MFMPASMSGAAPQGASPGMGGMMGQMPMGGFLNLLANRGMPMGGALGLLPMGGLLSAGNLFEEGLTRGLSPIRPPQPSQFPTPPVTYNPLPGGSPLSSMPQAQTMTTPPMNPSAFGSMNPMMFGGGNPFAMTMGPGRMMGGMQNPMQPRFPSNVGPI
jgi:hypothetical protein